MTALTPRGMNAAVDFCPAELSPCRAYRYVLRREVAPGSWNTGPHVLWCGANPSKADELVNDPTIVKEIGFSGRWGFHGLVKVNVMPWRATKPRDVPRDLSALGQPSIEADENHAYLVSAMSDPRVSLVVAAWGDCLRTHPLFTKAVARFLDAAERVGKDVMCLGLTANGNPKHPLMLSYETQLTTF